MYIDDSKDHATGACVYSALAITDATWRENFGIIKALRRSLKQSDGINITKEFHATDFVGGRGRLGDRVVYKGRRAEIFKEVLTTTASLKSVGLFNGIAASKKDEAVVFERVLNRISKTLEDHYAILFCDEGKETEYTRLCRRMAVHNPIPSAFGTWDSGETTKNIPITNILEDPVFKESSQSYFVQIADFCAYALLRKERPIASKTKYGLDKAFDLLDPILVKKATKKDPQGVLRV